jgi:hypothetical protein
VADDSATAAAEVEQRAHLVEVDPVLAEELADRRGVSRAALVVLLDLEVTGDRVDQAWRRKRQAVVVSPHEEVCVLRPRRGVQRVADTRANVVRQGD